MGEEQGNSPVEKHMGIKGVYPWGKESPPPKKAGNYGFVLRVDKFRYTAPVGSFAANKFGLHDMGGNVREWCEDKHRPTGTNRVLRGESWYYFYVDGLLSSYRYWSHPNDRHFHSGFRCVLVGK